jgi:hypothetical protein
MFRVLISLDDQETDELVRASFKLFPSLAAFTVPHEKLTEIVADPHYHAVIVNLSASTAGRSAFVEEIRALNAGVEIIALVDREEKDRFNKMKVDLGLFSCILTPIDPFDLAKKVLRLEQHLREKRQLAI